MNTLSARSRHATSSQDKTSRSGRMTGSRRWRQRDCSTAVSSATNFMDRELDADDISETDDEEIHEIRRQAERESASYLQIAKLLRFATFANQTKTVLSLVMMEDLMVSEADMVCFLKLAGLKLLINLLSVDYQQARIASLKLLCKISTSRCVQNEFLKLGGLHVLLDMIEDEVDFVTETVDNHRQMHLALSLLSVLAISRRIKRFIHDFHGIPLLIGFLRLYDEEEVKASEQRKASSKQQSIKSGSRKAYNRPEQSLKQSRDDVANKSRLTYSDRMALLKMAAEIVRRISDSRRNAAFLDDETTVELLHELLKLERDDLDASIIGIIVNCSHRDSFGLKILSHGLMYHLIRNLRPDKGLKEDIQIMAAKTISMCATALAEVRDEVRSLGGLYLIAKSIENAQTGSLSRLQAALDALRCCLRQNLRNCSWFANEGLASKILELISCSSDNEVRIISLGVIKEFILVEEEHCYGMMELGAVDVLCGSLMHTASNVLVAIHDTLASAALNDAMRREIIKQDALRLVWSNLKSKDNSVISSSARAIFSFIIEPETTSEMVRSFVGGLELLVKLIDSPDEEIKAAVCNVISRVALDEENKSILDDYGVVEVFMRQLETGSSSVQMAICRCIVSFSATWDFRETMKESIHYLGCWLKSGDTAMKHAVTQALFALSDNDDNCVLMYNSGSVKHLIALIRSEDEILQEAAARCVRNIRKTALAAS